MVFGFSLMLKISIFSSLQKWNQNCPVCVETNCGSGMLRVCTLQRSHPGQVNLIVNTNYPAIRDPRQQRNELNRKWWTCTDCVIALRSKFVLPCWGCRVALLQHLLFQKLWQLARHDNAVVGACWFCFEVNGKELWNATLRINFNNAYYLYIKTNALHAAPVKLNECLHW